MLDELDIQQDTHHEIMRFTKRWSSPTMTMVAEKMPRNPEVSICIITYNQERYIAKAIQSALMQKTVREVEIVVSDDGSTDSTADICREYAARHPKRIRFISQPKNLGTSKHWVAALQNCRGRYVALCEGDDYFSSPRKIDYQARLMEQNPDFSLCSHEVYVEHELARRSIKGAFGICVDNLTLSGVRSVLELFWIGLRNNEEFWRRRRMYRGHRRVREATFSEVLAAQFGDRYIHTVSMFASTEVAKRFPTELIDLMGFHRAMIIWLSVFGRVLHVPDVMSTRVIQSTSSVITKREKRLFNRNRSFEDPASEFLRRLKSHCTTEQRRAIDMQLARRVRSSPDGCVAQ